jgi:hypothetical protein
MQPQQPYTNPYDFIVNPQKPQKPLLNLGGPNAVLMRVAVVGIGVVLLIVLAIVVSSLFKGSGNVANMTIVAQDQAEIIRVTTLATQDQSSDISQPTTLYFAENCVLAVGSEQQKLTSFLSSNGVKLTQAQLGLKHNAQTDSALNAAAASSTYDTAFLNAMQGDVGMYVSDIKTAYAKSTNPKEKQLLATDYSDAQLLATELHNAQGQVNAGT